mmetsp:Transcript_12945/g.41373  ORF Transcript_12945/g.41373 Transcript_12945/m.41373 type:complete len:252 (+) Transcript_12945:540-1295(+)
MPDAAALFDGAVYSKDTHGRVFALSMDTGKELWSTKVCDGISQDNGFVTSHGGVVMAATDMREEKNVAVRDLNATDGAPVWTVMPDVNVWNFMASFPGDGTVLFQVYGYPGYTVVQPMGQQVLQGAPTDVYAYDAATGRQRWVFRGPRQSGKLQAGDGEGMFERLTSGLRAMCLPNPWSAPTIDAGGTVFVGNQDGKFFALRDLNGDGVVEGPGEVSSFETHAAFSGSAGPSLSPGRVAVASCDSLFVFDE